MALMKWVAAAVAVATTLGTAAAEESIRVQWTPDDRGIKIIAGYTVQNSICALVHVKSRADAAPPNEKGLVWASVEALDTAQDGHPRGTWFISGNGETTEVAVRCTKFWRPNVVMVEGAHVSCRAGWGKFSVAKCPEGYQIVGGSCDFTCANINEGEFKHASSLMMVPENQYRCGIISTDTGNRTYRARASCLKIGAGD